MSAFDHIHPALKNKVRLVLTPRTDPHEWPGSDYGSSASIEARHSDTNELLGHILWDEGKVKMVDVEFEPFKTPGLPISVEGDIKGRGIGTALWLRAQKAHEDEPHLYPKPQHSDYRTGEGDDWVTSLYRRGLGPYPPHNKMDDEED